MRRTLMHAPGDDRFSAGLRACTAELARIIDGDLDRPVPACPGWTFRQLATHLGRGHRWAAQIVATRATAPVPMREVTGGKLPEDPARHAAWLNAGADQVIEAVAAAGNDLVWTMTGMRPAGFWTRRRAHEAQARIPAQPPDIPGCNMTALLAQNAYSCAAPQTRPSGCHKRQIGGYARARSLVSGHSPCPGCSPGHAGAPPSPAAGSSYSEVADAWQIMP
jgi:hypothetical protein